jgi:hypothetical protein
LRQILGKRHSQAASYFRFNDNKDRYYASKFPSRHPFSISRAWLAIIFFMSGASLVCFRLTQAPTGSGKGQSHLHAVNLAGFHPPALLPTANAETEESLAIPQQLRAELRFRGSKKHRRNRQLGCIDDPEAKNQERAPVNFVTTNGTSFEQLTNSTTMRPKNELT